MRIKPKISTSNQPAIIMPATDLCQREKRKIDFENKAKYYILLSALPLHRSNLASFYGPIGVHMVSRANWRNHKTSSEVPPYLKFSLRAFLRSNPSAPDSPGLNQHTSASVCCSPLLNPASAEHPTPPDHHISISIYSRWRR